MKGKIYDIQSSSVHLENYCSNGQLQMCHDSTKTKLEVTNYDMYELIDKLLFVTLLYYA